MGRFVRAYNLLFYCLFRGYAWAYDLLNALNVFYHMSTDGEPQRTAIKKRTTTFDQFEEGLSYSERWGMRAAEHSMFLMLLLLQLSVITFLAAYFNNYIYASGGGSTFVIFTAGATSIGLNWYLLKKDERCIPYFKEFARIPKRRKKMIGWMGIGITLLLIALAFVAVMAYGCSSGAEIVVKIVQTVYLHSCRHTRL